MFNSTHSENSALDRGELTDDDDDDDDDDYNDNYGDNNCKSK
jgi:hypothetical protein